MTWSNRESLLICLGGALEGACGIGHGFSAETGAKSCDWIVILRILGGAS